MFQYPTADPDSIRLVDQDPDPDAGSGSGQADFVSKKEKMKNFQALMLRRVFLKGWRPPGECIA